MDALGKMLMLAFGLSLTLAAAASPAAEPAPAEASDPAARVKAAITDDWTARTEAHAVVLTSPVYAMPFGRGCVIHRLYFMQHEGQPSLGDMIVDDRYYVFASGEACAGVDPGLFFSIEPGNDVEGLLDFGRGLKSGPRPGTDRVPAGVLARIAPCFAAEAIAGTRIVRAHSWRSEREQRERYQATIACKALEDEGEIVATGLRGGDAVEWAWKPWGREAVDQPAPARP